MAQSSSTEICKIEALVTIDDRGQMVLPKEVRDRMGVKAGDKLALIIWEKEGKACCITLIPAAELTGEIKAFLDSVMGINHKDGVKK